ncbi:uncharacterized protein LOC115929336 [Strongylocentrotus purpuratus]|uniref:Uncharacterized protein n=1 Tax=Strongylocentrotus purpuratus TaxID=7668 RepID=A0A7M7PPY4_STRPU|nr:uncharacterized protein LOC115929336 [Strongylocentrotus purpuratus]
MMYQRISSLGLISYLSSSSEDIKSTSSEMVEQEGRRSNGGPQQGYGTINAGSTSINCVNAAYESRRTVGKKRDGIKWPDGGAQAIYVIFLLTLLNAANKMDRYVLIEVIKEMAEDLEFGDRSCLNATTPINPTDNVEEREKYSCDPQR